MTVEKISGETVHCDEFLAHIISQWCKLFRLLLQSPVKLSKDIATIVGPAAVMVMHVGGVK